MRVTLQDVAREAGVSLATASRVLGGREARLFVPSTRQRIKEAAERLGYRPSFAARALATGRTSLVTLWSKRPYVAFSAAVVAAVQEEAHEHGYGLLVADAAVGEGGQSKTNACAWPSDGMLAMDCGPWAERILQARPSARTPIVSMGSSFLPETDTIELDLAYGFRQATEHLVAQGCRRIAYCNWRPEVAVDVLVDSYAAPRAAYQTAMQDAGLDDEYIHPKLETRAEGRRTVAAYIRKHGCPDALLCRNDELAVGAYRAMCDLGIRVGQDVLLVGCDGIQDTQYLECPISTIVLPVPRMCELGWKLLMKRMADPEARLRHEILEPTLVVRESSATPLKHTRPRKKPRT